jgi:hypothetical protein
MTVALRVMVETMTAEIQRQDDGRDIRHGVRRYISAIELDLEKVARGGLAAIREPSAQMIVAGERVADCPDEAWPEMIDVIAKD